MGCDRFETAFELFIDGAIDEPSHAALLTHKEGCPACEAEYAWLQTATRDLECLGDAILADAPPIDVVEEVLARIAEQAAARPTPLVIAPRTGRRTFPLMWAAGLAAAAALVMATWFLLGPTTPTTPDTARVPAMRDTPESADSPMISDEPASPLESTPVQVEEIFEKIPVMRMAEPIITAARAEPRGDAPSTESVLASFREAVTREAALSRLVGWATLREDEAQDLVSGENVTPGAIIGAVAGLSAQEAAAALLTITTHMPDDPYVRYRLAASQFASGDLAGAGGQLEILQQFDPQNALTGYLEAQRLLAGDPPDIEGAMLALSQAGELDSASAYGLEAARFREEALIASGTDPEVARLLSALTAGRYEYSELTNIATDLLSFGREYEAAGDLQTASAIYDAVFNLGAQLDNGANLAQERLAALDIQREAADALAPIYGLIGDPEEIQNLAAATDDLVVSIFELSQYFSDLNMLFDGELNNILLIVLADAILDGGDLGILDFFAGLLP